MKEKGNIGRLTLYKYCLITIIIVLIVPIVTSFIFQFFLDGGTSVITFCSTLSEGIKANKGYTFIKSLTLIYSIWWLGPFAERLIIEYNKPAFLIGGLTLLLLWMVLFLSSTITAAIENTGSFGELGFWSAMTGWFRYGLPFYLV